jgi:hypothetical protein
MSNTPSAEHPSKKKTLIRYTADIISYIINYMAFGFLTPVIILTFKR